MQQEIEVQGLRLSPQQKRLWLWQQQGHAGSARAIIVLDGSVDEPVVQGALCDVIARHESLRTSFYRQPGMKLPFQVVEAEPELDWQVLDLRHLEEDEKTQAADQAAQQRGEWDWERGPLVRALFCRWSPAHTRLFLDVPGLCADTRSLSNLTAELSCSLRRSGVLEDEPVQYSHYSEWQHELIEGDEAAQGRAWWDRRKLTDENHLVLPFERDHAFAGIEASSRTVLRGFSASEMERLRNRAAAAQVSLPLLLCGCWVALLYRMTLEP